MKHFFILIIFSLFLHSCTKLEDYEGNNMTFEPTTFDYEEILTLVIPNNLLNIGGLLNCTDLGIFGPISYGAFIPASTSQPEYALLMHNVRPKSIQMEMVNVPDCDFSMLQDVVVYAVNDTITDFNDTILQNPNDLSAPFNAVKIGEYSSVPDGIGSVMYLQPNTDAVLDQFNYAGDYQIYMDLKLDKALTVSDAIIKSRILFEVSLINEH